MYLIISIICAILNADSSGYKVCDAFCRIIGVFACIFYLLGITYLPNSHLTNRFGNTILYAYLIIGVAYLTCIMIVNGHRRDVVRRNEIMRRSLEKDVDHLQDKINGYKDELK